MTWAELSEGERLFLWFTALWWGYVYLACWLDARTRRTPAGSEDRDR